MIPVNEPLLDGKERVYLNECIESGWISSDGAFVERFERAMAGYVGRRHAIAVANGSAALDVAAVALRLGPDDEVIIPTHTIISCASAIVRTGGLAHHQFIGEGLVLLRPEHWTAGNGPGSTAYRASRSRCRQPA
ncbi:DegT/DnrJ/EryC1/StrS family aminotransferase [Paraburkholderia sp. MM5477-R1]|uniref:DegT/DnrJ/EryC1/StrS family aminotransferase n=1 Tax=Paraburkholderia sp. MM5477-R1 TaxID=2991062 RepID=UPI003D1B1FC1